MKSKPWHSGPPPSVGWWPASCERRGNVYRWWDGICWSRAASEGYSMEVVVLRSSIASVFSHQEIQWQTRPESWPKRSKT